MWKKMDENREKESDPKKGINRFILDIMQVFLSHMDEEV